MTEGIEDPHRVLEIVKGLKTKGYNSQVSRTIFYNKTKSGYLTKDPEFKELTIERLEEIVLNEEPLPTHQEPIIFPDVYGR